MSETNYEKENRRTFNKETLVNILTQTQSKRLRDRAEERENRSFIFNIDSKPKQRLLGRILFQADGAPESNILDKTCIYGRYYPEYQRYFLGVVPESMVSSKLLPFDPKTEYCYGVVWSDNGSIDLHLVSSGQGRIIREGEDITEQDVHAFTTFLSFMTTSEDIKG